MKTTGKQWQKIQLLESPNLQNWGCLIEIRQTVYFKLISLVSNIAVLTVKAGRMLIIINDN